MNSKRLEQLKTFLEATPNDSFILFAIAKEYEGLGDLNEALAYYLKLYKTSPSYVGLYYHLGKVYELLDQQEAAAKIYDEGMLMAQKASDNHAYSELMEAKGAMS